MRQTLFELWLTSRTTSEERWAELSTLIQGWKHRLSTIKQWNNVWYV